jgi:hypothetical protein
MSTTLTVARRSVCVPILLAAAVALWLSASPASHATTATQTQSIQATVPSGVTWGSSGGCSQTIAAADFGSLAPGLTGEKGPFTGCVTTSTPLSVSVAESTQMTSTGTGGPAPVGTPIPASALSTATGNTVPAGSKAGSCTSLCSLSTEQTLFTAAPAGTSSFTYHLSLAVPASQLGGVYTGGVLTFTATA